MAARRHDTWRMAPLLPPEVPTRGGFVLRPQDIPERFPIDSDTWYFCMRTVNPIFNLNPRRRIMLS